tara:strand:+ start:442 stop:1410 length:969 start_codon:yes stop_codon:yes gene_type:complete
VANYTTAQDLVNDILFRAGEPTDGTSDFDTVALQYLNRAYHAIWAGGSELVPTVNETWWWLRKDAQGTIILNPVLSGGTANVTHNSATVTLSAQVDNAVSGRFFKSDDHADVFLISTHTASTVGLTLDSVYTGTTATGATYKIFNYDHVLATDVLQIIAPMRYFQDGGGEINLVGLPELQKDWPMQQGYTGMPHSYARVGNQKIRFSHAGRTSATTDLIRIDYDYSAEPADLTDSSADIPVVPRQHRKVLADWALFWLLIDKDDPKYQAIGALAAQGLQSMASENRKTMIRGDAKFGQIIPREDQRSHLKGPLRTESGHIVG